MFLFSHVLILLYQLEYRLNGVSKFVFLIEFAFVFIFASVFLIVEEIRECLHRRARSQWRRSKTTMDAIAAEL